MPELPIPLKPHSVWGLSDSMQFKNLPGCDAGMKVNKQGAMSNTRSFFFNFIPVERSEARGVSLHVPLDYLFTCEGQHGTKTKVCTISAKVSG